MNRLQIVALDDEALRRVIAVFDNTSGAYSDQMRWAKVELERRGVDFSDCLDPQAKK